MQMEAHWGVSRSIKKDVQPFDMGPHSFGDVVDPVVSVDQRKDNGKLRRLQTSRRLFYRSDVFQCANDQRVLRCDD